MALTLNFKNGKPGKLGNVDTAASPCVAKPHDSDAEMPGNVIHIKAGAVSAGSTTDWRDLWELHRGRPVNNHSNAMVALRNDPTLNTKRSPLTKWG
jgi:hypothetical protein